MTVVDVFQGQRIMITAISRVFLLLLAIDVGISFVLKQHPTGQCTTRSTDGGSFDGIGSYGNSEERIANGREDTNAFSVKLQSDLITRNETNSGDQGGSGEGGDCDNGGNNGGGGEEGRENDGEDEGAQDDNTEDDEANEDANEGYDPEQADAEEREAERRINGNKE